MPLMLGTTEMKIPFSRAYLGAKLIYEEVAEQDGVFVMIGDDGLGYWSKDGKTWTACTGLSTSYDYAPLAYGNGMFVTHGCKNSGIYISSDGKNWERINKYLGSYMWERGVYGNEMFIFVGQESIAKITGNSKDTLNATYNEINSNYYYNDVACGAGKFVAVGSNNGASLISYSTDGITWTDASSPYSDIENMSITYGAGKFVLVNYGGTIITSTDGITWTNVGPLPKRSSGYYSIIYANDMFVATGSNSGYLTFWHSTDGTTWTMDLKSSDQLTLPYPLDISYGNGRFVTYGYSNIFTSTDGITWESVTAGFTLRKITSMATNYKQNHFTSNIIPIFARTQQSLQSDTITNELGTWTITCSSVLSSAFHLGVNSAFDGDDDSYWQSDSEMTSNTSTAWLQVDCPVAICPKTFKTRYSRTSLKSQTFPSKIQGLNQSTGEWENLCVLSGSKSDTITEILTANTANYYKSFRMLIYRYGSSSSYKYTYINAFEIIEGKIK